MIFDMTMDELLNQLEREKLSSTNYETIAIFSVIVWAIVLLVINYKYWKTNRSWTYIGIAFLGILLRGFGTGMAITETTDETVDMVTSGLFLHLIGAFVFDIFLILGVNSLYQEVMKIRKNETEKKDLSTDDINQLKDQPSNLTKNQLVHSEG